MRRAVASISLAAPLFTGDIVADMDCAICHNALGTATGVRKTRCNHYFCSECITRWLAANPLCPLCNHDLTAEGGSITLSEFAEIDASSVSAPIQSLLNTFFAADGLSASTAAAFTTLGQRHRAVASPMVAPSPPDLNAVIRRVTNIMDRAKAEIISEISQVFARLE